MQIVYIGQKGDPFASVPERDPNIDAVYSVSAGKFRRYYGEGLKQLLDLKTMWLNLRDVFRLGAGFFQSRRLMKKLKPSIVFSRGGYVSVPVALGAHSRGIPFITHDSDSIPSLANRIIARFAAKNAVALPADIYPYDQAKTVTVGVPVMAAYKPVTPDMQAQYRQELQYEADDKIVFVIGGGLGAQRINEAVLHGVADLFLRYPKLRLLHVVGQANEEAMRAEYAKVLSDEQLARTQVFGYIDGVYRYSGAADVVVTRAGASSLADFAVQGRACIVIPNPYLTAGHQLKNAAYLEDQQATVSIVETELRAHPELLVQSLSDLLDDPAKRAALGARFATFGHPESARELAELVLQEASPEA